MTPTRSAGSGAEAPSEHCGDIRTARTFTHFPASPPPAGENHDPAGRSHEPREEMTRNRGAVAIPRPGERPRVPGSRYGSRYPLLCGGPPRPLGCLHVPPGPITGDELFLFSPGPAAAAAAVRRAAGAER